MLAFQLEILPQANRFKREGEFDGLELLHHFRKHVNPSTAVGASILKGEIETENFKAFGQDLKKYHTWIEDCKTQIDGGEGEGNYMDYYYRCKFKTYKTCTNKEFQEVIKEEKRKWITGKLVVTYT